MMIIPRISLAVLVLGAAQYTGVLNAQETGKAKEGGASSPIERGRYIVESVAMCGRCHTAYNQAGENERHNKLLGGPNTIQPSYAVPNWAVVEPRLAGRPPGTDEEFIRLLTTGISRTGAPPKPPMPPFRMTRADAEAVLAYLKSLPR
jgi:mono/diheme cytochrome c family protein